MARNHESTSSGPDPSGGAEDRKSTKRKKRSGFAAPIPAKPVAKAAEAEPHSKPSALDEALANLALKKRETAEEKPSFESALEDKETRQETDEATTQTTESVGESATAEFSMTEPEAKEENADDYDKLKDHKVEPNEFSGGEVIIHLQGNEPIAERVIPLHADAYHSIADSPETEPNPESTAEEPPIFHSGQEAQQQPAPESAPTAPENPTSASREVPPPLPPERTPPTHDPQHEAAMQPPETHIPLETIQPRPEDIYDPVLQNPETSTPHVVGGERPATKQEVEDAIYVATKSGQNRGVLAGLLVGGGYEHFKHKRREKRQEKRFKKQGKQLDQNRKDQHFFYEQQAKNQSENQRRFAAVEQRANGLAQPEKQRVSSPERPQIEAPEQQLAIPADHRLETSAWHSIEVDNKTGKPVEHPAFTYGQEYYRERAQEVSPKAQRNAAAGEVALVAAAMAQNGADGGQSSSASAPFIPMASTQGSPSKVSRLKSGAKSLAGSNDSSQGPLWPWLVALVVVVICLAIVIGL